MQLTLIILVSIFYCQTNNNSYDLSKNIDKEIKQARAFERANMLDEAMDIYVNVINVKPNSVQAIKRIKSIFRSNQDTTTIRNVLKKYEDNILKDPVLMIEIMELNIWTNNDSWMKIGNQVYTLFNDNPKIISLLLGRIINNGFINFAITYIEQYRNKIDDFYSLELGNYYTSKMLFENSLEEYLLYLKYNPQNYKIVSNRIMMFPNISEIQKKCIKILNDSSIQNSKLILSDIEFRAENFEESYYLLKNNYNNPNDLIEFAQEVSKLNLYDKAIGIYSDIIDGEFNKKIRNKALMGIANCFEKKTVTPNYILPISSLFDNKSILECPLYEINENLMPPLWNAISIYDSLSYKSENALLKLADIKFKGLNDIDSSIKLYKKLIIKENDNIKFQAGLNLVDAYLVKGELNNANSTINNLKKQFEDKHMEIAIKELTISFFLGSIEESLNISNKLLEKLNKRNSNYNEILSLKSTLLLFMNNDVQFKEYSLTQLLIFQNKKMQALENLLVFTEKIDPLIQDMVYYQIALLSLSFNDTDLSVSMLNNISNNSIYIEMAAVLKAEIFDYIVNDKSKAVDIYLNILNSYPNSINYENIRFRLREIAS